MNILINRLADTGVANEERIIFKAVSNVNIGKYNAMKTQETSAARISSKPSDVYWFPDKEIRAGENIVLYTKSGVNNEVLGYDGVATHYFHWGLAKTIFNKPQDSIVLLAIDTWSYMANNK